MTQNAKMRAPKEMSIEKFEPGWDAADSARAAKRMRNICATPKEIKQYQYDPVGARENRHPGIPVEDYGEYGDQKGGPGIDYTD